MEATDRQTLINEITAEVTKSLETKRAEAQQEVTSQNATKVDQLRETLQKAIANQG